jgi:hypothetical protein
MHRGIREVQAGISQGQKHPPFLESLPPANYAAEARSEIKPNGASAQADCLSFNFYATWPPDHEYVSLGEQVHEPKLS